MISVNMQRPDLSEVCPSTGRPPLLVAPRHVECWVSRAHREHRSRLRFTAGGLPAIPSRSCFWLHFGAGSTLCRIITLPIVWSDAQWARLANAPPIRAYPQPPVRKQLPISRVIAGYLWDLRPAHSQRNTFAESTEQITNTAMSATMSSQCADQGSPIQIPRSKDTA